MAEFKVVYGLKDGKCVQQEYKEAQADFFLGKKIGDKFQGKDLGLDRYELEITGGSDKCGFPMRKDVSGSGRAKVLAVKGVGIKPKRKGQKQRKTIVGNTINENISQINVRVLKAGSKPIGAEESAEGGEEKSAEVKEEKKEAPAEKKEEPKSEAPKEEKKEENPAEPKEEKKEEPKAEEKVE